MNNQMKSYWKGYRHCKQIAHECGMQSAIDEYRYGLQGCSPMHCKGFKRYLQRYNKK